MNFDAEWVKCETVGIYEVVMVSFVKYEWVMVNFGRLVTVTFGSELVMVFLRVHVTLVRYEVVKVSLVTCEGEL